jgi:DNA-binding MarR family transcriptional regulator
MHQTTQRALWLVSEIRSTASCLWNAQYAIVREFGLNQKRWLMLVTIERSDYFLSISDLARSMRVSRQAAYRLATRLAEAGLLELLPNRDDRRILQIDLTTRGRSVMAQIRAQFAESALTFAATLDQRTMNATSAVLREIRVRLAQFRRPAQSCSKRRTPNA